MTSTFPEAFGMVAAEAAACGALPVVANHSGLGEVAATLAAAVPPEARAWLSFELGDDAVTQLADALSGWLAAPADLRAATRDGDRRHDARALLLDRRRPHRHRRGPRRPRVAAADLSHHPQGV